MMRCYTALAGAGASCALAFLTACATTLPQAAPDADGPAAAAQERTLSARQAGYRHVDADVRFMQHMIQHHRQALAMTSLVADRSARSDVRTLARRIELSQDDEIRQMERWLEQRGAALPGAHAHHGGHEGHADGGPMAQMPGMLTSAQLARLADASGPEFDRLFLEYMIFHHEGAIVMVAELLASEGAAQEAEIFQFASHVESDQRIEIERMRRILGTLP